MNPESSAAPQRPDRRRVTIVGDGRAGGSLALALPQVGWQVVDLLGRGADLTQVASDADLILIATPDHAIETVADAIGPGPAVIAHVAGSKGLDVLGAHGRVGAFHPLMALPDPKTGARRLLDHGWFAVAGDPLVGQLVASLGGRPFTVADEDRAAYHAAAAIAANHLTALLGQVERVAGSVGIGLEPFLDLAAGALDATRALGPAAALTGPAVRGDRATIEAHLGAIGADEIAAYRAMMEQAVRLAGQRPPAPLDPAGS